MVLLERFSYLDLLLIREIRWYGLKVGKIGKFLKSGAFGSFLLVAFPAFFLKGANYTPLKSGLCTFPLASQFS